MRVKMLEDAPGSPDGVTVNEYSGGEVYEVTTSLGDVFVQYGLAVETEDDPTLDAVPEEVPEGEDAEDVADESKLASGPRENK